VEFLTDEELQRGIRLACQAAVAGPTTVEVPAASRLATGHKILAESEGATQATDDPPVRKQYVEMPRPDRDRDDPDLLRLEKAVGTFDLDVSLLRALPGRLRQTGFCGTAVLNEGRLIDFEPSNTEDENYAVAFDVGTTTLVGTLLDVNTGAELAVASRLNPQTPFGDDVLSRILHSRQEPDGLRQLQRVIAEALNAMVDELCQTAEVARERLYLAALSGNTTMQQLLLGVDPGPLAEVPFVPATGRGRSVPAAEVGLRLHPRATAYVLPVIGGFVGGDTVSGILATALTEAEGPTLLVDVGTNGEIVLFADGKLTAASTAAGPAFEGARISQGMRGSNGAIEKVVVDGRLRINVIGDVPPVGLCGSGLIDLAAELLRHGILRPEGRLRMQEHLPGDLPDNLAERLIEHQGQPAFLIAPADETAHGEPIVLTQRDLRELQLATGAIRCGIAILIRRAGLAPADLDRVLIAGGFGNFIRRSNAQRIGLLPGDVPHHRIRYQGNTSLAGARLTALSRRARQAAEETARQTEHVDLSREPGFAELFAESMIFPAEGD